MDIRGFIGKVINWASILLLGRLVLFTVFIIAAIGINAINGHFNYVHDREVYGINDNVTPSYVFNNRGCQMLFSEDGQLHGVNVKLSSNASNCTHVPNAAQIISQHKENARGINRVGSVGWQIVLAIILALVIFNFRDTTRIGNTSVMPMIVAWIALFPVTFGSIYTDYTFITKSTNENYSGYVITVYPGKDDVWYPLPHTTIAKHTGGSVQIASTFTFEEKGP